MICRKCSFNNADSAVFCTQCGTNLKVSCSVTGESNSHVQAVENNQLQQPVNTLIEAPGINANSSFPDSSVPTEPPVYPTISTPVMPSYGTVPSAMSSDKGSLIVAATKKLAASPLMIVAAAALTISTVFSFVSFFANFDWWKNFFSTMLLPFVKDIENFTFEDLESLSTMAAVFGGIFVIVSTTLLEIGIWSTVFQGFSRLPKFNTSGLSSIKSALKMFVTLAYCSIGYLALLLVRVLISFAEKSEYGYSASDDIMAIVFSLFFMLVLCALVYIVAYSGANSTLSRCENSMKNNGSSFYASPVTAIVMVGIAFLYFVCLIIPGESSMFDFKGISYAGVEVLSFVRVFSNCFEMFKLDVFSLLAAFFFAVSSVCFAVMIFMQRNVMTRVNYDSKYLHY